MRTIIDMFPDTDGIFKKVFFTMIDIFLSRGQVVRLSKAMLNRALGNNNGNMATNGEIFLMCQIMRLQREEDHKFVAFDVGANVGQWATSLLEVAEISGEGGETVHCFEPSPATFSKLQSALAKDMSGEKVFCLNAGLSDSDGTMELYINEEGAGINSFYKRRLEGLGISYDEQETVKVTTVDNYCHENAISHIDFLKVDVEGHELAVMRGAADMMKKQAIDYIQFEYGGCWIDSRTPFFDMYDFLTGYGYVIGKIMPEGIEFYDKYDQRLETYQMANFFACKLDHVVLLKQIAPAIL